MRPDQAVGHPGACVSKPGVHDNSFGARIELDECDEAGVRAFLTQMEGGEVPDAETLLDRMSKPHVVSPDLMGAVTIRERLRPQAARNPSVSLQTIE